MIPASPLSIKPPTKVRDLRALDILDWLGAYYGEKPDPCVCDCDYSIWECSETGLQFAYPARQGNQHFYRWVGGFASYYPTSRWEYAKVRELALKENLIPRDRGYLLDVGSGRGDFLKSFDLIDSDRRMGIDLNKPAVDDCVASGISCYCGTIDSALETGFVARGQCDIVVSFHCLEHVENPVAFTSSLLELCSPEGRVFLSTPNSPMSFEGKWFDILNHPPHHLSRWNQYAYKKLAETLGCHLRTFFAPTSLAGDVAKLFRLLRYGANGAPKSKLLLSAALHPMQLLGCAADQIARRRKGPAHQSDVILVELRRK